MLGEWTFTAGKIAFAAIGVAVGLQLAAEVRRGGALGLHMLALAAIGVGGLGLLAMPLAEGVGSETLSLAGELAVRLALLMLCFFVAGTFRPGGVGIAGAVACSVLLVATLAWDVVSQPSLVHYDYGRASSHASQLAAAVPFAWSAIEASVAWLRARRRQRVGLGNPELTSRFLLWSLATGGLVAICVLAVAAGATSAAGADAASGVVHGLRGVLYLAVAALIWRARFAPSRRAAAETAPAA